ncbi:MAG: DHHW family protein [Oscillospiraceae bacterium]
MRTIKKQNKKSRNIPEIISCIIFFGFFVIFAVITIFKPKETFSDLENKALERQPKLSAKTWFDRSYTNKLEKYIADHFSGRVGWLELKSGIETAVGKKEISGIYILKDRLIEKVSEPNYTDVDKSIMAINQFANENDFPVYTMLVPTSAEFYKDQLADFYPELDQRGFIDYVYAGINDEISKIDVYDVLDSHKNEYIFYRTDHHWTSLGAYYAYELAGEKMGYTPHELSYYDVEHASDSFKGTFYSKTLSTSIKDDTMDYYHAPDGDKPVTVEVTQVFGSEPEVNDSIYFRDYLNVKDKYASFLGTNAPIVTIKTGNEGGKLLVVKDSYAHCYSQFLVDHYSEITLIDMRYIQISYKKIIDVSKYDEALILYNVSSFAGDTDLKKLLYN